MLKWEIDRVKLAYSLISTLIMRTLIPIVLLEIINNEFLTIDLNTGIGIIVVFAILRFGGILVHPPMREKRGET